jgi:hypothetical protein
MNNKTKSKEMLVSEIYGWYRQEVIQNTRENNNSMPAKESY